MDYLGGPLPAATSMAATAAECFLQQQRVQSNLQHSDMNGYKYGNGTSTENHATITDGVALASPSSSGGPQVSVILTIRLLMQGKEVGSIIGKRGDHVKLIRDKSSAKVNISDGSCPERIVTITGNTTTINAAFAMVARKFEEDLQALPNSVPKPPITMRLIVPATQCGSLIGKGGSKIKEIREKTGASIQVATEMLPSSTERAVTISGTCEAITDCMQEICQILLEAPPKGATLPFRPKPSYNPLMVASSAAAAAAAQQQASQHIVAAAFLQQQQQPQTQLNPYGNALANSAPMPVVSSSLGSLQQELSKFPFSLAPDGSIIPTSAVARSQILNLTSSASDVSGLIGSMPLGSGLTNFVGFPTATHPFHTPVSAALFVQGVHPNIGQTSNAGMLGGLPAHAIAYGGLDQATLALLAQHQQQSIWQQHQQTVGDKQDQQQHHQAAAAAFAQQQQQQYDLLQSLGYPTSAAYTLNTSSNGLDSAANVSNRLAISATRNVQQSATGTQSSVKQQKENPSGYTKATRFSPY